MVDDIKAQFTEDDDVTRAKAWWQENGKSIITGISIGLAVVVGYNFWQSYSKTQAEQASQLYEQVRNLDAANADDAAQKLFANYSGSPYSVNAALLLAADRVADGELQQAETHLRWALEHSGDKPLGHVARLRLASILLQQDQLDDAITLLKQTDTGQFKAAYLELLGDAYVRQDSVDDARSAYQQSLQNDPTGPSVALIKLKLDNLEN